MDPYWLKDGEAFSEWRVQSLCLKREVCVFNSRWATVHVVCKSAFLVTLIVRVHMTCLRVQAESWVLSLKQKKAFIAHLECVSSVKWVIVLLSIVVSLLRARFLSCLHFLEIGLFEYNQFWLSLPFYSWVVLLASCSVLSPPQLWHYDIKEESSSEGDHSWRLWVSFHIQCPCNKVRATATFI